MRRFLGVLFLSLLTATSALQADDIVVYRGAARFQVDSGTASTNPPSVRAYWIVNYTTRQFAQILYFNKLGKKKGAVTLPLSIATAILPNNKVATLLARGASIDNAEDDFGFSTLLMRGPNVALTIETNPARRSVERPRALTVRTLGVFAAPGAPTSFQEAAGTAAVDVARTINANNSDLSLETVRDSILGELTERGYQDID